MFLGMMCGSALMGPLDARAQRSGATSGGPPQAVQSQALAQDGGMSAGSTATTDLPGQLEGVLRINDRVHAFLERQQTAGLLPEAVLSNKPLSAYEANAYLRLLDGRRSQLDPLDAVLLDMYLGRTSYPGADAVHGWWDQLYGNGRDFVSVDGDDWSLLFSPVMDVAGGKAFMNDVAARFSAAGNGHGPEGATPGTTAASASAPTSRSVWRNSRGMRFAGHAGRHIYFDARFTENQEQVVFPNLQDGSAPRRPSTKLQSSHTYDWMDFDGVVGFRSRHFDVRFGRDTNRFGPGLGSVILSNYATAYDQLRIRAELGPFQYVSMFSGFSGRRNKSDSITPRKYGVFHRLSYRVGSRLEFGLYESVIFVTDTLETRERFDLSYLNPVIFLRAAERDRGSPDNALIGASAAFRPVDGLKVYGEFLLDEFKSENLGKQWWANKWAWMVGAHGVNVLIPRLDLRAEFSRLRPFLYAHDDEIDAYVHFGDVLGHPAGPNAWDLTLQGAYVATRRIALEGIASWVRRGRNPAGINLGADPRVSYDSREMEYDNAFLQGIRQNMFMAEGRISFEMLPSFWIDAALEVYSLRDADLGRSRFLAPQIHLRWGMPFQWNRY